MLTALYRDDEVYLQLEPLCKSRGVEFVEKAVQRVRSSENLLELVDGSELPYDALVLNIGSRTRGTEDVQGVDEHTLKTRPINKFLGQLHELEEKALREGEARRVLVVGGGAAAVELAFGLQNRWKTAELLIVHPEP